MNRSRSKMRFAMTLIITAFVSACHAGSKDVDEDVVREQFKKASEMITTRTIVEGAFWGMHIGEPKRSILQGLIQRRVQDITPLPLHFVKAHTIRELERFRDAKSLVLGEKYVAFIRFNGDRVKEALVFADYPWKQELEAAKTRDKMFAVLAKILEQQDTVVWGNLLGPDTIMLAELSEDDWSVLEKYDAWELSHNDADGYWHLRLEFSNNLLVKIVVRHSPFEGL